MKIEDIKINQKVIAIYMKPQRIGTVIKKLKTVVYIKFGEGTIKFDKGHLQFLKKYNMENNYE